MCDWLCRLLGCGDDSECKQQLVECHEANIALNDALEEAQDTIRRLELISPRPAPPVVNKVAQKDSQWVSQMLAPLKVQRLPLDAHYYLCNQTSFFNIVAWDWVDTYKYESEVWDCDKFAVMFKAHVNLYFKLNNVGLVIDYGCGHAYNLVLFENKVMIIEPQNDSLWVWDARPNVYTLEGSIVLI